MKKHAGFTLIEMMIVVALLSILLTMAVPAFQSIVANSRATAVTNDLVGALQVARSEALKQRLPITVCRGNAAATACNNGTDWSAGWLVRSPDRVLQVWSPSAATVTIASAVNDSVIFVATGASGAANFCIEAGESERQVNVSATGRVSSNRENCP